MRYASRFGFYASNGKCDPSELAAFERSVPGGRLPEDYREFLLEWNGGGFPDIVSFPLLDEEDEFGMTNELSGLFDPTNQLDLRKVSTSYGFRSTVPLSYIIIGGGVGWNSLCISLDGPDRGHVFYWDPGEPWLEHPPTTQFLRPVAGCFRDFWNALVVDED